MNDEVNYKNNPLHGLSLKNLLVEIVDCYGFELLFAYLNLNCFKTNASIESSVKFLKKTDWAREKVEAFYLYQYKNLPRVSSEQFAVPPRDRIVPDGQEPGEPAELSFEDAERLQEKRAKKAADRQQFGDDRSDRGYERGRRQTPNRSKSEQRKSTFPGYKEPASGSGSDDVQESNSSSSDAKDPWAKWK